MGGSFYFRENVSDSEETIVFVHGGGIGGRVWQSTLHELKEYHCLAPDLPGFGGSAHITPFSLESSVEGLAELIRDHARSSRAAVVGFSIGAVVSMGLIERHPDLVEKAFLSGPTPKLGRFTTAMMNTFARPMLSLMGSGQGTRFLARSMGLTDEQIDEFREDLDHLTPDLVVQINQVVSGQGPPKPNSTPLVVFAGEKELGSVKTRARELVTAFENGQGYVVKGLGHMWCLENPELFHRTLQAWMSGGELGDGFGRLPG